MYSTKSRFNNTINNFEIEFIFELSYYQNNLRNISDTISLVLTSENKVLLRDLTSSFACREYVINSRSILPNVISTLGFPKNLHGLSPVLDTFANDPKNKEYVPFLDTFPKLESENSFYDIDSDGLKSGLQRLNKYRVEMRGKTFFKEIRFI